jgi:hypothetical protein
MTHFSSRIALSLAGAGVAALLAACTATIDPIPPSGTYGPARPNTGNGSSCSWPQARGVKAACDVASGEEALAPQCSQAPIANPSYNVGQEFPSPDGCNTCVCTSKGIACTERACVSNDVCVVDGVTRRVGDQWGGGSSGISAAAEPVPAPAPPPSGTSTSGSSDFAAVICGEQSSSSSSSSGSSGSTSSGSSGSSSGSSGATSSGASGGTYTSCECKPGGVVSCVTSSWTTPSPGIPPQADPAPPNGRPAAPPLPPERCVCKTPQGLVPLGTEYKDDCNICTCTSQGPSCSKKACGPEPMCVVDGKQYKIGEAFQDQCNSCVCALAASGPVVTCTARDCGPLPPK